MEICTECGRQHDLIWSAYNTPWLSLNQKKELPLCASCLDAVAEEQGLILEWKYLAYS